ncbi:MAG: hypothetical protein HYZ94_03790 [Candidatus Omnitrophica bacterium]|nr:hypothetical protein [Candidatus Omnitrophota bacterium]
MKPLLLTVLLGVVAVSGCRGGFVNIERPKGEIEMRRPEGLEGDVRITPATASQSKNGVDVTVRYASPDDLEAFFEKKEVFGDLAGKNPYPADTLVFFVRVSNHSGKRIMVNPQEFVMIDNLNIQYSELSPDNISAMYEAKATAWSFAKTTGDLAPGYYGAPLKVAGSLGGGSGRKLHYLMKQVRLAVGFVFPGIAYDGYVAFPRPHPNATSLRLIIHNIKTDFNPADEPVGVVHFEFPLQVEIEKKKDSSATPASDKDNIGAAAPSAP